jgi:hypothetical protein
MGRVIDWGVAFRDLSFETSASVDTDDNNNTLTQQHTSCLSLVICVCCYNQPSIVHTLIGKEQRVFSQVYGS